MDAHVSMDFEQWRPVQGYRGYECSNYGRVRKTGAQVDLRFVAGYGMRRVTLRKGNDYVLVVVAEIILTAFVCPKPAGKKAYCVNGNYEDLAVTNLQWVKRKRDKYTKTYVSKKQKREQQRRSEKAAVILARINRYIEEKRKHDLDSD